MVFVDFSELKKLIADFKAEVNKRNYCFATVEVDIFQINDIEKLIDIITQISEICVEESKSHITTQEAIKQIREVL